MDGKNRKDIYAGITVDIVLKKDQRTGKRTRGVVKDILTKSPTHPRGIKVRLMDGQIGRVQPVYGLKGGLQMNQLKDTRWRQRFINFEKSFQSLSKYIDQPINTEIERAGIIQLFEIAFELSWKLMKDYLEALGFSPKSPRETIKQAYQTGLIEDGHIWIDALADRNLTVHTYDENLAKRMTGDIVLAYFPELKKLYAKLIEEL